MNIILLNILTIYVIISFTSIFITRILFNLGLWKKTKDLEWEVNYEILFDAIIWPLNLIILIVKIPFLLADLITRKK